MANEARIEQGAERPSDFHTAKFSVGFVRAKLSVWNIRKKKMQRLSTEVSITMNNPVTNVWRSEQMMRFGNHLCRDDS